MPAGGNYLALAGFIMLSFLAPLASVGIDPRDWYSTLLKPVWSPPGWLFGPVWALLYVSMGVAAWGIWNRRGWSGSLALWLMQLGLNAAWTPVFFGLHRPDLAFAVIAILWVAILATLFSFRKIEPWCGWILVPYFAWVTFASALNFSIWHLNR